MKDAIPLILWALLASTDALGSHTTDFRNPMDRDFSYTVVPRSYEPKKTGNTERTWRIVRL